jgi:surface polysaccharide O-acyltransferase-like enzyme
VTFPALCNTFLPLFLFASGFLISRDREMLAWLLAIPFYLAVILLWFAAMAGNA